MTPQDSPLSRITGEGLTFDDVLLRPAFSSILPHEVSLKSQFCRGISLHIPLVSAAMDSVTESALAIAMAQEGGVGVIHKNLKSAEQADEVRRVKKFESGIVIDPITIGPSDRIRDVLKLTERYGVFSLPVLEQGRLVGIITERDLRFQDQLDALVSTTMTPRERLVTVAPGASRQQVLELLHRHRIEKVPVVDSDFRLRGLITAKDLQKAAAYPRACKDSAERLMVAAAIGPSEDGEERAEQLVAVGVNALVIDTAHGHSDRVFKQLRTLRRRYPELAIIGGNIATGKAARDLVELGVDAVKVGVGPGSICTTRVVSGVGVPQITAISEIYAALRDRPVPIIADGGIRYSGDVAKALAAGADTVMLGGLFAGADEAPGEVELYQGRAYKGYRGMGSIGAMRSGSADRYGQQDRQGKLVPEGIEGRVPYKGPLAGVIHQLLGGLSASMGYLGCRDLVTMKENASFIRVTAAAVREGHVHDVTITKEAPNYHIE